MAENKKKWSDDVTDTGDAMDLEEGVLRQRSARKIARSLRPNAAAGRTRAA